MSIPFQNPNPDPTPVANQPAAPSVQEQLQALRKMIEEVIDERVSGFNERLESIEQHTTPPPPQAPAPQAVATDDDFYTAPAQASQRIAQAEAEKAQARTQVIASRSMIGLLEQQLAAKDPDFPLLKAEYEAFRNTLPPEALAAEFDDGTSGVERAFWGIRGRYQSELNTRKGEQQKADTERKAAEADSLRARVPYVERARGRADSQIGPGDKLDDEQKKVQKALGLTEDQYLKSLQAVDEGKQSQYDLPEGY